MDMKKAYQDKMAAQLKEWQAKIDVLKAKAHEAKAEQKIKYYEQIEILRVKQQQMQEKLAEIRSAGEGAWEELKTGVDAAWQDLKESVERAREKFK